MNYSKALICLLYTISLFGLPAVRAAPPTQPDVTLRHYASVTAIKGKYARDPLFSHSGATLAYLTATPDSMLIETWDVKAMRSTGVPFEVKLADCIAFSPDDYWIAAKTARRSVVSTWRPGR